MKNAHLIVIDPQNDFCLPTGALSIPGAYEDMERLAAMITKNVDNIDSINVTLDSHHPVHIAHPIWWVDQAGKHPTPFTLITMDDVTTGKWRSYNPGFQKRSEAYVKALADGGRYVLCIWPEHCLIGTPGAAVVDVLNTALRTWEKTFAVVNMVTKGSNMFTEHYSAVKADVEDPEDVTTSLNTKLVELLRDSTGDILIAGEALSHCVANTIRDIASKFTDEQVKRFVLLEDACSNVTGFEVLGQQFVTEMTARGMRLSTTTTYFA
jgi:nicotinamidase-related amidase